MTHSPETETTGKPAAPAHARPIKTLRIGRIKAAVWENKADQRTFYNVTFSRSYLDEEKRFSEQARIEVQTLAHQQGALIGSRILRGIGSGGGLAENFPGSSAN